MAGGGDELIGGEDDGGGGKEVGAEQTGGGEEGGGEVIDALGDFAQPRVDVAAEGDGFEVGAEGEELGLAAEGGGADFGVGGELLDGKIIACDPDIGRVFTRGRGSEGEAGRGGPSANLWRSGRQSRFFRRGVARRFLLRTGLCRRRR